MPFYLLLLLFKKDLCAGKLQIKYVFVKCSEVKLLVILRVQWFVSFTLAQEMGNTGFLDEVV